uniref:Uncharacterized protein n=1 Tax=Kalanchoe fedtschenkoi TaxID=63787 RepID=A0A7N0T7J8_KALFE
MEEKNKGDLTGTCTVPTGLPVNNPIISRTAPISISSVAGSISGTPVPVNDVKSMIRGGRIYANVLGSRDPLLALKLPLRSTLRKDDRLAVVFKPLEMKAVQKPMEHAIVLKFSIASKLKMPKIVQHINRAWNLMDGMTIATMDARHVLIYLNSARDVVEALTYNRDISV